MGLGGARLALLVLVLQTDLARKRKLTRGSFRWGGTEHWASSFQIQDDTDHRQLKLKSALPIIVNFKTNIFARNIWSNEVCCEIRLWCPIRREWWAWLGECGIWDLGSGTSRSVIGRMIPSPCLVAGLLNCYLHLDSSDRFTLGPSRDSAVARQLFDGWMPHTTRTNRSNCSLVLRTGSMDHPPKSSSPISIFFQSWVK